MLTFLHAADIHLDSPLHNLDLYEGAPVEEFRQATRRAFENLIHFENGVKSCIVNKTQLKFKIQDLTVIILR